ncbi:DUF5313 domain-containing protein [Candidatus Mycolicibacterium alkanivorans]|uniref:DUF5313 domain-containing protein n=1 Tax=Candidatus Mycolicibacterium alkanivorans TaxID=2954114 RepID=A0ABS9YSG8_9MYCO|nr:DUF5313 domain-containing protein [Candidatus Mycolicibacterium alkanivorans]MCI4673822.1 DUF5313 domain-containing protein [Candidatus Mycolicibacterium alkanivorans]
MSDKTRPNPLQYLAYCYGKVLPPSMQDWVRNDLAGKGARRRTLIRVTLPGLLLVSPLWLIPTSTGMHLAMSALLFLPFLYFAHALDKVWRTHRLRQHNLDPELVDELARQRDAHIHEAYRKRHGRAEDTDS